MAPPVYVLCVLACLAALGCVSGFTLTQVERKISLKTPIARVTETVTAKNTGSNASNEYVFCLPARHAQRLGHMKVKKGLGKATVGPISRPPNGAPAGVACYSATLDPPVQPGSSASFEVFTSYSDAMIANPAKIKQGDKQFMEYSNNLYVLTPYPIESHTVEVVTGSKEITSHEGGKKSDDKVTYGADKDLRPWATKDFKVHFAHTGQFKRANTLVKEIQLSMWGNIYVEEVYEVQNAGAAHKGPFSRFAFQHNPGGITNSWQRLRAKLPAQAHSLYYKDLIGNVSTSDTSHSPTQTIVDLEMRYPLMGGWKIDFTFGYSLPLEGFLYRRPDGAYRLLMDFSTPFDDLYVDQLEVRVVLPEGASDIKWMVPFDVDQTRDKKYSYLDTAGRPVLVLKRGVTLPVHNQPFAVDFKFTTMALLREPLLLVGVFAALFLVACLTARLDFTITKDKAYHERLAREKARTTLSDLQTLWKEEGVLLARFQRLAEGLTHASAAEAAASVRTELEDKLKGLEAKAKAVLSSLEAMNPKVAAIAQEHADKGKALQQRLHKLVVEKADQLKKGEAAEVNKKMAPVQRSVSEACQEWSAQAATL